MRKFISNCIFNYCYIMINITGIYYFNILTPPFSDNHNSNRYLSIIDHYGQYNDVSYIINT